MKLVTFDDLALLALTIVERPPFRRSSSSAAPRIADLDRLLRRGRRRATKRNLARFYPQLSEADIETLVRGVFQTRWSSCGEHFYRAWERGEDASRMLPSVEGLSRLRTALERNRGVILWESPFGSRARMHLTLLSEGLDFIQVHGAEHGGSDSWIGQRFMRGYRRALEAKVVPETVDIQEGGYSYLRRIKARLAANGVVCMPGMGPKGRRFIQLDFLGGKASIATGVASLSLSSGASLIPVYCFRDRKGVWRTVFEEPAPIDPTENRRSAQEALVEWYARTLESYVRRYPTQWRRWHANSASAGTTDLPAVSVDRSLQNRGEVS